MSLNLTPNEVIGYRIKPDWYSFNVVAVKRHGPSSKNAGKEYETPLAYCKNLSFAAEWILGHASRVHGELNQKEQESVNGTVAQAEALAAAFITAQEHVNRAVEDLQARLEAAGILPKTLVRRLGSLPGEAPVEEADEEETTAPN